MVKDHLALDEINIFLKKRMWRNRLKQNKPTLYEYILRFIDTIPAGSAGVIFNPLAPRQQVPV
jgi:xylulokinase